LGRRRDADLLTRCVTAASPLVISRCSPSIVAVTGSSSASISSAGSFFRVPSARVAGLPFFETVVHGRLAAADRVIVLVVRHMWVICFGNPDHVDYRNTLASQSASFCALWTYRQYVKLR
jgi:hypothetical protein